jgi:hypothetical protein
MHGAIAGAGIQSICLLQDIKNVFGLFSANRFLVIPGTCFSLDSRLRGNDKYAGMTGIYSARGAWYQAGVLGAYFNDRYLFSAWRVVPGRCAGCVF